ncbi:thiosulfate/3-mercaptopyruvate sulfurtransferase [Hoeflea marina]|uniref:3-mercaptopyruvate sulfurtransferase n=1 Tax=Hoeflea marina TaxID=274592 RepID=A0A317PRZ8_9HYPH|nr:3-mercaptopyruvate sulfurtransferase [Hoeflea marina]PWW04232.1 thiosulfate/3-mercaptopyruvate sulfurtransferase [Hoeflea marina]
MTDTSPYVVSFDWLAERLDDAKLRIVDASWYLPAQNRDPVAEYQAARIPGALFFDQDRIVEPGASLPHTLPGEAQFAAAMGGLGLSDTDTIVVYDGPGMFTAPRVWWMLKSFGARDVLVLDGGFDRWKAEGRPVETGLPRTPEPVDFAATLDAGAVASFDDMMGIVTNGGSQIADARGPGRFTGVEAEPRAGMRSGHMPGARNVPVMSLSAGGKLKSLSELRAIFDSAGVDLGQPVVTTCGSGVTAAVITLALRSLGHQGSRLYDGSWSEWGGRDDTPVATGEA